MNAPRISVAMATYEGARHVEAQIRSILAQDAPDLELVISDDGSTDGTLETCRRIAAEDGRVRLLEEGTGGLGVVGNFERALQHTRAPVVALADQDDLWDARKLSTLAARLERGHDLVVCDLRVISEEGELLHPSLTRFQRLTVREGHPLRELLIRNFVTGCASAFTRELLEAALPFPEDCRFHDWWLAVVAAARRGIGYVPEPLVSYRQHGANVVGATGSGLARLRRVLDGAADAADPAMYEPELRRVRSYASRPDVFDTPARRADLDFALRYFEDHARRDELPLASRVRLMRARLRFQHRGGVDTAIACAGTLFPRLSRWLVRRAQRRRAAPVSRA